MEAIIKEIKFSKEFDTQFGKAYSFAIKYDDKLAYYTSKSKKQTKFKIGEKAIFTEEFKEGKDGFEFIVIRPEQKTTYSNFNKALVKEKTKYSGFAVSYAKDLCVAGNLELTDISSYATVLFELMVQLDKTLEV